VDISEKTVTVNGLSVHFWEAGQGNERTLILLHGGIGDAQTYWKAAIPQLAETYHVIAPDLPGYGGTTALSDISMTVLIQWLRDFFTALDLEQAVIIGSAITALPVRLFAAAHPQFTPAIILINGGALPNVPRLLSILARIPGIKNLLFYMMGRMATSRSSLDQMIFVKEILTDDFVRQAQANAPNLARLMRGMLVYPIPDERIPRIPTLLLWGANDMTAPLEDGEALKREIPGAKVSPIAECGKFPQLEATDVFVYQVNYFLERLSQPPSNLPGVGMLKSKPT
jgi:pimeloyl-ACP methyl ester carboxylesterase